MDETLPSPTPAQAPRPERPDLDSWRGDIREQPPRWRRRPKAERVLVLLKAAGPLLARIGEETTWR